MTRRKWLAFLRNTMVDLETDLPTNPQTGCKFQTRCWFWMGNLHPSGYGYTSCNNKPSVAHKLSYESVKGKVPEGLVLDHLCRNRDCINYEHLEAVTQAENMRRGDVDATRGKYNSNKTHCYRGHEFTESNTCIELDENKNKKRRVCITCKRARALVNNKASYARRKLKSGGGAVSIPQKNRTHCLRGHEFNESNTYLSVDKKTNRTHRGCKICSSARSIEAGRAYRERQKLQAKEEIYAQQ